MVGKESDMKKISQTLLIVLLLIAGVVNAQSGNSAYEYATVSGRVMVSGSKIFVSYSSGESKEIKLDKSDAKISLENQTAVLKFLAEMSKDGWEVVNSQVPNPNATGADSFWCYFLKRKQK